MSAGTVVSAGTGPIYRTTDPEIIEKWLAAESRWHAWKADVDRWAEQFPEHVPLSLGDGRTGRRIIGLHGRGVPGDLWRLDRTSGHGDKWTPNRRSRAGKALYEEMEALVCDGFGSLPGMPDEIWGLADGRWCGHGVWRDDETIWVWWPDYVIPEMIERPASDKLSRINQSVLGPKFDGSRWETARPSQYYAAREDAEAALEVEEEAAAQDG